MLETILSGFSLHLRFLLPGEPRKGDSIARRNWTFQHSIYASAEYSLINNENSNFEMLSRNYFVSLILPRGYGQYVHRKPTGTIRISELATLALPSEMISDKGHDLLYRSWCPTYWSSSNLDWLRPREQHKQQPWYVEKQRSDALKY